MFGIVVATIFVIRAWNLVSIQFNYRATWNIGKILIPHVSLGVKNIQLFNFLDRAMKIWPRLALSWPQLSSQMHETLSEYSPIIGQHETSMVLGCQMTPCRSKIGNCRFFFTARWKLASRLWPLAENLKQPSCKLVLKNSLDNRAFKDINSLLDCHDSFRVKIGPMSHFGKFQNAM